MTKKSSEVTGWSETFSQEEDQNQSIHTINHSQSLVQRVPATKMKRSYEYNVG